MGKRIALVFEEGLPGPEGVEFKFYLEGITEADKELLAKTPENDWPTAVFWALKSFGILQGVLKRSGAFRSATPKNPTNRD